MNEQERNRARVLSVWTTLEACRDIDALDDFFSEDYVRHVGSSRGSLADWKDNLAQLYSAFPDLHTEVTVTVAERDVVAYRWVSTGHHRGPYYGVPPTGLEVTAVGITLNRFREGRIVEEFSSWNKVDVLHDLGILALGEL